MRLKRASLDQNTRLPRLFVCENSIPVGAAERVAMTDVLTTVSFRVKYWTEWGQNLVVVGSHKKLGEWDVRKGIWMHCEVRDILLPALSAPPVPPPQVFHARHDR